jgi:hypothetical protein
MAIASAMAEFPQLHAEGLQLSVMGLSYLRDEPCSSFQ